MEQIISPYRNNDQVPPWCLKTVVAITAAGLLVAGSGLISETTTTVAGLPIAGSLTTLLILHLFAFLFSEKEHRACLIWFTAVFFASEIFGITYYLQNASQRLYLSGLLSAYLLQSIFLLGGCALFLLTHFKAADKHMLLFLPASCGLALVSTLLLPPLSILTAGFEYGSAFTVVSLLAGCVYLLGQRYRSHGDTTVYMLSLICAGLAITVTGLCCFGIAALPVLATTRLLLYMIPLIHQLRQVSKALSRLDTLKHKALLYEGILEDSQDAIIMCDTQGTIQFWNCGASEMYRLTQEEAVGKSIMDLIPLGLYDNSEEALQDLIDKGLEGSFETKRVTGDGETIDVSVSVVMNTDENFDITGITTNDRDLTDRIEIENELRMAKEQAEHASRTKSQFLANMSHEIRTPMNGVMGMTNLVLDTDLTAEQRQHLELVKTSADALLQIINDILDFSKIEAGKIVFEEVPFSLQQVLSSITASMEFKAQEKLITLVVESSENIPAVLIGDPTRISQVLNNLMGNAIKFTPRSGGICVQVLCLELAEQEVLIECVIADSGIGIPEDKQELIFEAFSQADASTTRSFGGTGLGLSISTNLIKTMGGEIWVESKPDRGTSFHFTLRLPVGSSDQLVDQDLLPRVENTGLSHLKVLIAEDNVINQKLAVRLLEKAGHAVTVVGNGKEAIDAVTHDTFDIVLMDCQMPVMGGFEATSAIRKLETEGLPRVPIIALTAHAIKGDRERCLEAGMDEYVSKPINRSELFRVIEKMLHQRSSEPVYAPTSEASAEIE